MRLPWKQGEKLCFKLELHIRMKWWCVCSLLYTYMYYVACLCPEVTMGTENTLYKEELVQCMLTVAETSIV